MGTKIKMKQKKRKNDDISAVNLPLNPAKHVLPESFKSWWKEHNNDLLQVKDHPFFFSLSRFPLFFSFFYPQTWWFPSPFYFPLLHLFLSNSFLSSSIFTSSFFLRLLSVLILLVLLIFHNLLCLLPSPPRTAFISSFLFLFSILFLIPL